MPNLRKQNLIQMKSQKQRYTLQDIVYIVDFRVLFQTETPTLSLEVGSRRGASPVLVVAGETLLADKERVPW